MWFIVAVGLFCIVLLLCFIVRNTGETLEYQQEIHKELKQINSMLAVPNTIEHTSTEANTSTRLAEKININLADISTLLTLPGVGKTIAKKIIDARPYKQINELADIAGISEEILRKIETRIQI